MAESPEQLAKVLAELEARRNSLRYRLSSLDNAIQGLQALIEPSIEDSFEETIPPVPVRETPHDPTHQVPSEVSEVPKTPAEREVSPMRPVHAPSPDNTRPSKLNIYVNQNADWAARQLTQARAPRSVSRQKTGHRCPKCGSQDTRISVTRGMSDLFMFLFDYSVARCRNCDSRFRIWKSRPEDDEPQELQASDK